MRQSNARTIPALAIAATGAAGFLTSATHAMLEGAVNDALGLRTSEIITLDLDWTPGGEMLAVLPIDGQPTVLQLAEHSIRSDSYELWKQVADGSLVRVEPGPVRTMRGSLIGFEGTIAAGSFLEDGLHAMIRFPNGDNVWLEPVGDRVPGARPNHYVIYRDADVDDHGGTCDALQIPGAPARGGHDLELQSGGGTAQGDGLCTAQLACDADFEYFQDYGSEMAAQNRIELVINTVNVQYERDVGITHAITAIIVRTSESDPYSSTDAVTLLNQFRNHWLANHGGITRDVAQLFTGKEINGGTIGIAWLNAVCTSYGFGVVQSDFNNNFACATDLSAHEAGHNWGADHCSCTSYTMNPYITCANVFHPSFSIPEIISFRDSRTCLDCGAGDPTGACCFDDGSCQVLTAATCASQGGTYTEDDVTCQAANCPQPTGACCLANDSCLDITADECAAQTGDYRGDGTDCASTTCGGSGGEATLTCLDVVIGTTNGVLAQIEMSDNDLLDVASTTSGRKRQTDTRICALSPHPSVSTMRLTVESQVTTNKVKAKVYLQRTNGRWTRVAQYEVSQNPDSVVQVDVSDPNRFIGADRSMTVRITTEKRNGTHTHRIDYVEILVTP